MKDDITIAAVAVLIRDGLQKWTVDRVAAEAGCAKGLVAYHHGSKKKLLAAVAVELGRTRSTRRLTALSGAGAEALDRLWQALTAEVRSGEWAAWLALAAEPDLASPPESEATIGALSSAVGRVLDVPTLTPEDSRLVLAALDGFQLALHLGANEEGVRESFHRLWLALLP